MSQERAYQRECRKFSSSSSHSRTKCTPSPSLHSLLRNPFPPAISPKCLSSLAAVLSTLAAIRAALAPLLTHKATTQRRQTRRQASPILLLTRWRRLLVLHLLALGRAVVHLLLGGGGAVGLLAVAVEVELVRIQNEDLGYGCGCEI
jgi:hypothetical protein